MRAWKLAATIVAAVVVIIVLLLFIGIPAGFVTSAVQSRVESQTGYQLAIGGVTRVGLWPSPNVTLNDVTLQNPGDRDTGARITIGQIRANMTLAGVWSGHPEITDLLIASPVVSVPLLRERAAPHVSAARGKAAEEKDAAVSIDRVTITDGSIVFFNLHDHVENHIDGVSAEATIAADRSVTVKGNAHAGDHALNFKATMPASPVERQSIPVDLKFEAPDLLQGPLTSTAQVGLNGPVIMVKDVNGTLGGGTFSGSASVDVASKPQVKLALDFQRLNVAMPTSRSTAGSQPWSNAPIDLIGLNYIDLQARISAHQFNLGGTEIAPLSSEAALAGGILKCHFADLGAYGGLANGDLTVDASGSHPSYTLHSDLAGIRALPLLQNLAAFDKLDGKLQARLDLRSSGASQHAIMSNLDGTASILFRDGAIRGINVAQMVRSLTTNPLSGWPEAKERVTDLTQLAASFRIEKGQATTSDLDLVGPLVRVTGGGTIDLGEQTLALQVDPKLVMTTEGQGRSSDPVGLGIPVAINGPWAEPRIYPSVAGMLDNPDAAYARLKQMGKGLFGENGGLNGLGGLLGGNGASGGSDQDDGGSPGGDLGQTLDNMIQQGLKQWHNFSAPSAPDQNDPHP